MLLVAHLELLVNLCFTSFHASFGVVRPLGIVRYLYRPDGRTNVVSLEDSSSSCIWVRPSAMSIVAKQPAEVGMCGSLSSAVLSVSASRRMYLLIGERSVTRSMMLLLGFGTKNAWQHHGLGSATFVILPLLVSSAMWASALAWYLVKVFVFFSILLTHEGSHREVYQDFQPSLTSITGGAKG